MIGAYIPVAGTIAIVIFCNITLILLWLLFRKTKFIKTFQLIKGLTILWIISQVLFAITAYRHHLQDMEDDKRRYFTLSEDTQYGDIITPKGTHIQKLLRHEKDPNAPHNLNDLSEARFPYPIDINGLSVIAISPFSFITFELTEPPPYVVGKKLNEFSDNDIVQVCPKGSLINMRRSYEEAMAIDSDKPTYPKDFLPVNNNWKVGNCLTGSNAHPHLVPYWKNGKLIYPQQ